MEIIKDMMSVLEIASLKNLGVEVEYVPVEAASRVEYLVSNKVDIILANFTVTEERKEKVDFTLPYMKVALRCSFLLKVN